MFSQLNLERPFFISLHKSTSYTYAFWQRTKFTKSFAKQTTCKQREGSKHEILAFVAAGQNQTSKISREAFACIPIQRTNSCAVPSRVHLHVLVTINYCQKVKYAGDSLHRNINSNVRSLRHITKYLPCFTTVETGCVCLSKCSLSLWTGTFCDIQDINRLFTLYQVQPTVHRLNFIVVYDCRKTLRLLGAAYKET